MSTIRGRPDIVGGYRPDLEGLRAIAVIAVVLYHCRMPGFAGGFVGVDVFFVLSGFLITGLLAAELDRSDRVDLLAFWRRRIRRLAPAQLLVIVITLAGAAILLAPDALGRAAASAASATAWLSNLRFLFAATDYHAAEARLDPLLHTWSLGVEAQFYLLWPLLLAAVARHRVAAVALAGAASFALAVILAPADPALAFYSLPTRMWELAAGGLLALTAARLATWAGWAGLTMIVTAVVLLDETTTMAALLPVAGTALVIASGAPWLGTAPLRWIGERSYSWYLWHWPLIVAVDRLDGSLFARLAAVGVALVLAAFTFSLVETRFRERRRCAA